VKRPDRHQLDLFEDAEVEDDLTFNQWMQSLPPTPTVNRDSLVLWSLSTSSNPMLLSRTKAAT
jgi:hypothetical protein